MSNDWAQLAWLPQVPKRLTSRHLYASTSLTSELSFDGTDFAGAIRYVRQTGVLSLRLTRGNPASLRRLFWHGAQGVLMFGWDGWRLGFALEAVPAKVVEDIHPPCSPELEIGTVKFEMGAGAIVPIVAA